MQAVTITQITPPELETLIENSLIKILSSQPNKQQPAQEELLTIQQTGELLSLSVPTLYGYVSRKDIPVSKRGKRLYFSKKEILEWVREGRKKTVSEIENETDAFLSKRKKYTH